MNAVASISRDLTVLFLLPACLFLRRVKVLRTSLSAGSFGWNWMASIGWNG